MPSMCVALEMWKYTALDPCTGCVRTIGCSIGLPYFSRSSGRHTGDALIYGRDAVTFRGGYRQDDGDRRPLPRARALGAHPSAVELDQMADDREPEPEAGVNARARAIGLLEAFEDVRQQVGLDTPAGVAHDEARVGIAHEPHCHGAIWRRELDRVAQDVLDDLTQPIGIAAHRPGIAVELRFQVDPFDLSGRAGRLHHPGDQRRQIDALRAELEPPEDDAAGVQQIADQPALLV